MCEHKERYLPFLQEMADHGYVCVIHDHRGHGGSVRQTEDLGYFYPDGGPALVSDLYQVTRWIREQYPELPLYLFRTQHGFPGSTLLSETLSGCAGRRVCLRLSQRCFRAGTGRTCPGSAGKEKRAHPTRASGWRMLSFPDSRNRSGMRGRDNAWICSDPAVVDAYNADPLCTFCFTLNGYEALLYLLRTAYSETEWRVTKPELPIRFLSGADDPCRGNDEKVCPGGTAAAAGGLSERVVPAVSGNAARDIERNRKIAGVP